MERTEYQNRLAMHVKLMQGGTVQCENDSENKNMLILILISCTWMF
jgi:hypothetical protein